MKITAVGQQWVTEFVTENVRYPARLSQNCLNAWFCTAEERAANMRPSESGAIIEIRGYVSRDGRTHTLEIPREMFTS